MNTIINKLNAEIHPNPINTISLYRTHSRFDFRLDSIFSREYINSVEERLNLWNLVVYWVVLKQIY